MKDTEWKLISELIKNSRKSDRALAKVIGASQPTVSRARSKLEKKVVREYTMIPNFVELGFELLVVLFIKLICENQSYPKLLDKAKDFTKKYPNVIFASTGRGIHSDRVVVSIHRDYSEYSKFMREFKREYADYYTINESFVVSLVSDKILIPLTLRFFADHLKEEK